MSKKYDLLEINIKGKPIPFVKRKDDDIKSIKGFGRFLKDNSELINEIKKVKKCSKFILK